MTDNNTSGRTMPTARRDPACRCAEIDRILRGLSARPRMYATTPDGVEALFMTLLGLRIDREQAARAMIRFVQKKFPGTPSTIAFLSGLAPDWEEFEGLFLEFAAEGLELVTSSSRPGRHPDSHVVPRGI